MSSVTVIGGGLVGLATALRLADAGHTVTLMDPSPASGATHHAGACSPRWLRWSTARRIFFP